jgi:hypothetical protein
MVVTHSSQTLGNNFVTHCFFSGSWCDGIGELSVLRAFKPASQPASVLQERAGFVWCQRQPRGYLQRAVGSLQIDFSAPYSCYCTFLCYSAYVRTLHTALAIISKKG